MARPITVLQWLSVWDSAGMDLPVEVRFGLRTAAREASPARLLAHGMPGVLEARIRFVTVTGEQITISAKEKDFITK